MKIKEITIYGFGRWVDKTFSFSDSNLITLLGENESGKTTLHQFILYMLFGMTKKKSDFYRPKTSSKLGGRMIIDHPSEGTILVERLDTTKVRYVDNKGAERDAAWFENFLGNMNAETFQSIYSFSNQDLAELQHMNETDISELLLSVGLTGSAAIYKVEKKLQASLQKQFKPSGTKPLINEKLMELRAKDKQVGENKQLEKSYKTQVEKIHALENKHHLKKEQIAETNEQLEKEKLMEKILPIRKEMLRVSGELEELADVHDFPLDHQEQIKSIRSDIDHIDRELRSHQDTLKTYTEKKQDLETVSLQEDEREKLDHLLKQKAEITLLMERQKTLEQDYTYKVREITEMIQEKQIRIGAEDLEQLELPFYLEKEWMTLQKEQEHIQQSISDNSQKKEQLIQEKSRLQEEQKKLNKELLADVHVDELKQRIQAYQQSNHQDNRQREYMHQMFGRMIQEKVKQERIGIMAGVTIALAAALMGYIGSMPWLFLLSLVSGIGVFYFWHVQQKRIQKLKQEQEGWQANHSGQEVDVTETEYLEAQEILAGQQALRDKVYTLDDAFQQTVHQIEVNDTVRADLIEQQNSIEEKIINQQNQFSFLHSTDVFYWQDIYHLMQKLLQLNTEKQNLKLELDRVKERIDQFYDQVKDWFEERGLDSETRLEEMMLILEKAQQQEQQYQYELQQLAQFIKEAKNKQFVLKQKKDRYREEQDKLLKAAGVDSEEIYFKKQARKEEYNKLYARQDELRERIQIMLPEKWHQELIEESLEVDHHYKNKKKLELALADYEEELEQLKSMQAEQKLRIEQLESAEDISLQMHQLAMEKEELESMVKTWAVQKTALRMLAAAKNQYKDKYLTLVIETAQIYFKEITADQYDTIYSPASEQPFEVENSKKKQRFRVEELSQGTKDQLYISLRLAINEVMSKASGLPFLMDDAFVHFDWKRTERMQRVLKRLTEQQQVILFTCHRDLAEATNEGMIHLNL
ncbi:ATP-binding protein [Oceanobacillus jeddahense]|uniref:AAA family ATPase n=1 Tax=Oceanobacillus jeddahense TaxID=1462527 RepID=A0ABY5K0K0_9BACI|nr:AAA family ATPase [Oceanobacillus jeddahense]UUI05157.1 AAA family ATPase [Oceanobacillus jeddahense]